MENVLEGVEIALARHIYVIGDDITKQSLN